MDRSAYGEYWILKFAFVTLAASMGMAISTILEEYVIARISHKKHPTESFFVPVWRANYITLGIVLLVAAIQILPQRLHSAHFLAAWLGTLKQYLSTS